MVKIGQEIIWQGKKHYIANIENGYIVLKTRQELENDSCCVNCKYFSKTLGCYKNGVQEIFYFCGIGGWKMSSNPTVLKTNCKEYNLEVKPTKSADEERYELVIERIRKEKFNNGEYILTVDGEKILIDEILK